MEITIQTIKLEYIQHDLGWLPSLSGLSLCLSVTQVRVPNKNSLQRKRRRHSQRRVRGLFRGRRNGSLAAEKTTRELRFGCHQLSIFNIASSRSLWGSLHLLSWTVDFVGKHIVLLCGGRCPRCGVYGSETQCIACRSVFQHGSNCTTERVTSYSFKLQTSSHFGSRLPL